MNYPQPSAEDTASIMAVTGVPSPGKTPVTKPNTPYPDEKAYLLKASASSIQGILNRKREWIDSYSSDEEIIDMQSHPNSYLNPNILFDTTVDDASISNPCI